MGVICLKYMGEILRKVSQKFSSLSSGERIFNRPYQLRFDEVIANHAPFLVQKVYSYCMIMMSLLSSDPRLYSTTII